jgi:hypothetical protein
MLWAKDNHRNEGTPEHIVSVVFNGCEIINSCFALDEDSGTVGIYPRDTDGRFIMEYSENGPKIKQEWKIGLLEVTRAKDKYAPGRLEVLFNNEKILV